VLGLKNLVNDNLFSQAEHSGGRVYETFPSLVLISRTHLLSDTILYTIGYQF